MYRYSIAYDDHLRERGNQFMKSQLFYGPRLGNGRVLLQGAGGEYLSVHLRRGDYVYTQSGEDIYWIITFKNYYLFYLFWRGFPNTFLNLKWLVLSINCEVLDINLTWWSLITVTITALCSLYTVSSYSLYIVLCVSITPPLTLTHSQTKYPPSLKVAARLINKLKTEQGLEHVFLSTDDTPNRKNNVQLILLYMVYSYSIRKCCTYIYVQNCTTIVNFERL